MIVSEGFFFKKRDWFFCFWIKKYFVLLNTGELFFIEKEVKKGNWNLKHSAAFQALEYSNYSHPFRLSFSSESQQCYFAFDNIGDRDHWLDLMKDASRG
jgi:hypothetical protein